MSANEIPLDLDAQKLYYRWLEATKDMVEFIVDSRLKSANGSPQTPTPSTRDWECAGALWRTPSEPCVFSGQADGSIKAPKKIKADRALHTVCRGCYRLREADKRKARRASTKKPKMAGVKRTLE